MKRCVICGRESPLISETLKVCIDCIRNNWSEASKFVEEAHKERVKYGLPVKPPKFGEGVKCSICSNYCSIANGESGFCGLRKNKRNKLESMVSSEKGLLDWYLDPHVTNCCAAYYCPAATGLGFPKYAVKEGPEYGYYNLAVFFYGCNFDCLFCQNWTHKILSRGGLVTAEKFLEVVNRNRKVTCICFFGGSPEPQLPFALNVSRKVLKQIRDRVLRVCFEWNGCGNSKLVEEAAELSLVSGGNIKFDLKVFDSNLSLALSGVSNSKAYSNFKLVGEKFYFERKGNPVLNATTLLVPGYVDELEVEKIAQFIADIDEDIPYSLLIFYPEYLMRDLPVTPLEQAVECYLAAKKHLSRVNVGNLHLLGLRDMSEFEKAAKKQGTTF